MFKLRRRLSLRHRVRSPTVPPIFIMDKIQLTDLVLNLIVTYFDESATLHSCLRDVIKNEYDEDLDLVIFLESDLDIDLDTNRVLEIVTNDTVADLIEYLYICLSDKKV